MDPKKQSLILELKIINPIDFVRETEEKNASGKRG
jgi:hypothetical protein